MEEETLLQSAVGPYERKVATSNMLDSAPNTRKVTNSASIPTKIKINTLSMATSLKAQNEKK